MKVIPIQGVNLNDPVIIPVRAYKVSDLAKLFKFEGKITEKDKNEVNVDNFVFVNRDNLSILIKDSIEENKILNKFKDIKTFAIINTRPNKLTEFYDLRVSLSIIYIAYRMKVEGEVDFFKQMLVTYGYFTPEGIVSTRWDVKIGTKTIDENDFDVTIPVYYTEDDEPESWRLIQHHYEYLQVDTDISSKVGKLYSTIIRRNQMATKLRSSLNLLYTTFNFSNLDVIIPTYATILETLLLDEDESNQRKKVSVRSACLIKNNANYESKEYIANWVYYFYKYRNAIVHDGKSYVELQLEEQVTFTHVVSLIQDLIFNIIKILVNENISCIQDIVDITTANASDDNLRNNFDYITENMIMYYED